MLGVGFKINSAVYEKCVGPNHGLYVLNSIGNSVELEARSILPSTINNSALPLTTFIKGWACFKGKLHFVLDDAVVSRHNPWGAETVIGDTSRAGLFFALIDYHKSFWGNSCCDRSFRNEPNCNIRQDTDSRTRLHVRSRCSIAEHQSRNILAPRNLHPEPC